MAQVTNMMWWKKKNMSTHCFIPGCKTGYKSFIKQNRKNGTRNPSLFSVPKDYKVFKIWQQVIPRSDKKFSVTDKICELHFSKDDIITHFKTVLPNGQVFQLERARATLKLNAVPTIFPYLPEYSRNLKKVVDEMQMEESSRDVFKTWENSKVYSGKTIHSKEMPTENSEITDDGNIKKVINFKADKTNTAVNIRDMCDEDINIYQSYINAGDKTNIGTEDLSLIDKNTNEEDSSEPEEMTFNMLVRNLEAITKPNNLWSVTEHGKFVMCAKWNESYIPEKRVVIDCNLNIKVYLKNKEVATYNDMCLSEISDVSSILHLIDR